MLLDGTLVVPCLTHNLLSIGPFVDLVSGNYRHSPPEQVGESDNNILACLHISVASYVCCITVSS